MWYHPLPSDSTDTGVTERHAGGGPISGVRSVSRTNKKTSTPRTSDGIHKTKTINLNLT
jgi:hypothetical protein